MMKIKEGKFITITGIDGAGKSTQSSLLSSALLSRGGLVERVEAKNPFFDDAVLDLTATEHRSLLWPKGDFPHQKRGTLYYLYLHASWFSLLDKGIISPKIQDGVSLICDGWTEKWSARALLRPVVPRSLLSEIICTLRHPDLTFLLDITPEEVQYRRSKFTQTENGKFDGFDGFVSYQTQIRSTLLDLASYYGWTVISASDKKPEVVTEEMINMLIDKGFEI